MPRPVRARPLMKERWETPTVSARAGILVRLKNAPAQTGALMWGDASMPQELPWEKNMREAAQTGVAGPAGARPAADASAPSFVAPSYEQVPLDVYDAPVSRPTMRATCRRPSSVERSVARNTSLTSLAKVVPARQ